MKKLLAVFLLAALVCASAVAGAQTISSLSELQHLIEYHAPADLMAGSYRAEISGTILDIRYCNQSNHYEMTLLVDDPAATPALGYDGPVCSVHFRLHLEAVPFQVGESISVVGTLNPLYSSVMIPWILADQINGSDEF